MTTARKQNLFPAFGTAGREKMATFVLLVQYNQAKNKKNTLLFPTLASK